MSTSASLRTLLAALMHTACSTGFVVEGDLAATVDAGAPLDAAALLDAAAGPDLATGCTSGEFWNANNAPGPEMHPGRACIQCHHDENSTSGDGDAPIFSFAGTVYPTLGEPDDCYGGPPGVVVEVTDARGKVYSVPVNQQGNFDFTDDSFAYPLTARVLAGGRERTMRKPVDSGDCNGCHSREGAEDAEGRIVAP